ncbi:NAD(P)-dependent oxidoreductase [Methanolobus halotolerans]|uniref:NAD(P)-dependent oxidoreductase n=1 Tax=Methanolobus halotolerans TaxID=2052935 RepID=A0A4E0PUL1_9EURY|nr:NAD(P)-dependent oxidoreductase [Methanolobus halotolerans]
MELEGQTAIVTGGGRGIGRATCLALARKGANIIVTARSQDEIEEVRKMVEDMGSKSLAVAADLREESDIRSMVTKSIEHFGTIDILVNNAGVAVRKPLTETSAEEYDTVMDVNVRGMFLCMKYVLPHMLREGRGKVINVSSGAGKSGIRQLAVYSASKFAVIGLTESVAQEVSGKIGVHAVCPGSVDTDMYRSLYPDEASLRPEDVAARIVELCLPGSGTASGSCVTVYGNG